VGCGLLKQEPNWQPISRLPMIIEHMESGVALAEEALASLTEGVEQPYRLDDATVQRAIAAWTNTRLDLTELFGPQGERWAQLDLGATRRKDVARYREHVARELELVDQILAVAEQLKGLTIEALMAKSDLEVGIEAVVRDLTGP
jgi:hypothetical protein